MCHLQNLNVVERFFEYEHLIRVAEGFGDLIPRVVRIRRADDDLQIGEFLPYTRDRLNPVPSRRHSHIDEGNSIGHSGRYGFAHLFQSFLTLKRRVDLKAPRA